MHEAATLELKAAQDEMSRWRAQKLFAQYAADAAKPHAGEHFKLFVRELLLRATEAELYQP